MELLSVRSGHLPSPRPAHLTGYWRPCSKIAMEIHRRRLVIRGGCTCVLHCCASWRACACLCRLVGSPGSLWPALGGSLWHKGHGEQIAVQKARCRKFPQRALVSISHKALWARQVQHINWDRVIYSTVVCRGDLRFRKALLPVGLYVPQRQKLL